MQTYDDLPKYNAANPKKLKLKCTKHKCTKHLLKASTEALDSHKAGPTLLVVGTYRTVNSSAFISRYSSQTVCKQTAVPMQCTFN